MSRKIQHPPANLPEMVGRFVFDRKHGRQTAEQWECAKTIDGWKYRFVLGPSLPLNPELDYFFRPKFVLYEDPVKNFRIVSVFILRELSIPTEDGFYPLNFHIIDYNGQPVWVTDTQKSDELSLKFVVGDNSPNFPGQDGSLWYCALDKVLDYDYENLNAVVSVNLHRLAQAIHSKQ